MKDIVLDEEKPNLVLALDMAIKALELKQAIEDGEELMPRLNDDLR